MGSVENKVCESCQGTGKRRDPVLLREEACKCVKEALQFVSAQIKKGTDRIVGETDHGIWFVPESGH